MNIDYRDGKSMPLKMAAGAVIEEHEMVAVNATGFAVPAQDASAVAVMGRAELAVNNKDGDDGSTSVLVSRKRQFLLKNDDTAPVLQADISKPCYIAAQNTVTQTDTDNIKAGVVCGFSDNGQVWVEV